MESSETARLSDPLGAWPARARVSERFRRAGRRLPGTAVTSVEAGNKWTDRLWGCWATPRRLRPVQAERLCFADLALAAAARHLGRARLVRQAAGIRSS